MFRKVWRAIRKTVGGENKVGEVIHGAADALPLPNQVIVKLFRALGLKGEDRKAELKSILTIRNAIALAVTVLFMAGFVDLASLQAGLELFSQILEVMP